MSEMWGLTENPGELRAEHVGKIRVLETVEGCFGDVPLKNGLHLTIEKVACRNDKRYFIKNRYLKTMTTPDEPTFSA